MADFAEVIFDLGYDYGAVGGPRFSTTIIETAGGFVQSNSNWAASRGRWQLGDRSLLREELDYFQQFFWARKGRAQAFRFKDWADYEAINELIGIGDGATTTYQLIKTYGDAAGQTIREIKKPRAEAFRVNYPEEHTLDTTNGLLTFASPPLVGFEIKACFQFDVPVRFEQDTIDFRFESSDPHTGIVIFTLGAVSVIEERL